MCFLSEIGLQFLEGMRKDIGIRRVHGVTSPVARREYVFKPGIMGFVFQLKNPHFSCGVFKGEIGHWFWEGMRKDVRRVHGSTSPVARRECLFKPVVMGFFVQVTKKSFIMWGVFL